jgi:hypothetical protein
VTRLSTCNTCSGAGVVECAYGVHPCPHCGGEGVYAPRRPYRAARHCPSCRAVYAPPLAASDRATRLCTFCARNPDIATPGEPCRGCGLPVDLTGGPGRPRLYCSACRPRPATMRGALLPSESPGGPAEGENLASREESAGPGGAHGLASGERGAIDSSEDVTGGLAAGPRYASLAEEGPGPRLHAGAGVLAYSHGGRGTAARQARPRWTGNH